MSDDQQPESPICGTCLGAGGEWFDRNGTGSKQSTWVSCRTCDGTGRVG
ncbi:MULTISPECIES: hypothetical protein [unclassified Nonomuraea]